MVECDQASAIPCSPQLGAEIDGPDRADLIARVAARESLRRAIRRANR